MPVCGILDISRGCYQRARFCRILGKTVFRSETGLLAS